MKVSITARHFDPTPDLKTHAESRVSRLERFTGDLLHANVVLEVEKYRQIAEVSVHGSHGDFTAKAESDDMITSIDGACDKVEKQIRRQARMTKTRDGDAKEEMAMGTTRIVSERVSPEMMSLEEATTRVEEGEDIVVFADSDSGATRVVYRRPDGSMKLIEVAG
ncbi:MAG: ribosome-associated translation inhibitor RaiA [bacterium]